MKNKRGLNKLNLHFLPQGNKRGEILIENIVFIILNMIFLTILVLFLLKQGTGTVLLEDAYSKQIALLIDSAKPGMILKLNMEDGFEVAKSKGVDFSKVVSVNKNFILVKLSEKGGQEYPFFNDVEVSAYPDLDDVSKEFNGYYILTISKK
jgi:hypothetical protein